MPRLPPEVQRQGVTVKKVSTAFLMAVSLVSSDPRYDALFLTNYAQINLVNQMGPTQAHKLLESSFAQYQADRSVVGLVRAVERGERILDEIASELGTVVPPNGIT